MDEMKIKLRKGFLAGVAERLLAKVIFKALKFTGKFVLHDADLSYENGHVIARINATLDFDEKYLSRLVDKMK